MQPNLTRHASLEHKNGIKQHAPPVGLDAQPPRLAGRAMPWTVDLLAATQTGTMPLEVLLASRRGLEPFRC